ncbi:MAG: type II secretion system secretin GspD [Xanthomonadales bacterium]|nr:type II secretion system secretin GspD [Xanthomonadales bacterium]
MSDDGPDQATRSAAGPTDPAAAEVGAAQPESDPAPTTASPELYPGSGRFIDSDAAQRPALDAVGEGEIIFNFEGEALQAVVKAILGDLLQENYVISPGIQGNVTFSTAKPVPMDQVLPILEMLLSWNNAALVYRDGRYHVMPIPRAVQGQLRPVMGPLADQRGYEVRAFPLDFIAPAEMEKLLRPYARENAFVSVDNARGLLILAGTRDELENYRQTIEIFDVDWLEGMSVGVYPLERVEADTVVGELEAVFGEGSGTPLAGMFRFMAIERLNAIMVITPQPAYLDKAVEWVKRLDRGGSEAGTRLYVYAVRNVKATDLADTLSDIFSDSGRSSSREQRRGSLQLAPGLEAGEISSINDPRRRQQQEQTETAERRPATRESGGGGIALVDGEEVRITAVEESNSLLIRATPGQYDAVLGAIKRLDIVPLQVLVEVQVLEVTLNENLRYGVQWFFESALNDFSFPGSGSGSGGKGVFDSGGSISGDRYATVSGGGGLNYAIQGGDAAAIVSALESVTDVRTISAPSMMVLNNREANINVGTQIPVNSPIFNLGTGTDVGRTQVQFRDTGVTLNVVPRVNPGGMVFMEVQQEVSAPIGSADAQGNVSLRQRRIDTEVAVQSDETVVLGGLIQADFEEDRSGLPWLSRMPLVGGLFGNQGRDITRTELIVLITPKVVASIEEARAVSREYRERMRTLKPLDSEKVEINN